MSYCEPKFKVTLVPKVAKLVQQTHAIMSEINRTHRTIIDRPQQILEPRLLLQDTELQYDLNIRTKFSLNF